jgi:hypothetical protein
VIRTAPALPAREFPTPDDARAHLTLVLGDWQARPAAERVDAEIVARRAKNAESVIVSWAVYRAQRGPVPTQWSVDAVKSLAALEERVYATAPLERPKDLPHDPGSFRVPGATWEQHLRREGKPAPIGVRRRGPIVDDGEGRGRR